jgi:hypothetical protein
VTDDPIATLRSLTQLLQELGIPWMLVGSMAALAHGYSRTTRDLDVVVDASADVLCSLVAGLPPERFYADESSALEALQRQTLFNVIDLQTGWKIDVIPRKRREFSKLELSRRIRLALLGLDVYVASAEDTIIAKLEWSKLAGGSARQIEDVAELMRLASGTLDLEYIEHWVEQFELQAEWQKASGRP